MINQADRELQAWVKGLLADIDVAFGPPDQLAGKRAVNLYLLALADPLPAWVNRELTRRIALRYLVTTWAEQEEEAHALLGTLVFAAMEKREYELNLAEIPATLWTALGIAPRPAFTLWIPCSMERPEQVTRLVRGPLVVQGAPVRSLHGIVLGPENMPIVGASVEVPTLQLRSRTDTRGKFHFAAVPGGPQGFQLVVRAKGHLQHITVEQSTLDKEPLTIRFASFETR